MEHKYEGYPSDQYKPISAWGYVGYAMLFMIPIVGFIFLLVFTFSKKNINRRNYARSYWCALLLIAVLTAGALFLENSSILNRINRRDFNFGSAVNAVTRSKPDKAPQEETEEIEEVEEAEPEATQAPTEAPEEEPAEAPEEEPTEAPEAEEPEAVAKQGDKNDTVKEIQSMLIALDYLSGSADGDYGNKTVKAVTKFQKDNGMEETGIVTEEVLDAIEDAYEDLPEPTATPTEKPTEAPKKEEKSSGVSKDFKKTMDDYEDFFDEYIEFMEKYQKNPNDPTLALKAIDMLSKEAKMLEDMKDIDEDKLSEADALYYVEVTARIEKKLLKAAL